ncbi:D-amino-acid transaminase [Lentibacillus halophilus]|uniref:D-alanine aminotransferase n=1 Tax=Lentibacillus halophilus TaxID=295065 RepID=A0ABN0ZH09_9BACI
MDSMLYNDQLVKRDRIIDIEDRGYQFGDGVYEVIGVYDGQPFLLDDHMHRLQRSAREIRLTLPFEVNSLKTNLQKLIEANGLNEGVIYLQVSRGVAPRLHDFPGGKTQAVTIAYTLEEERKTKLEDNGGTAMLTEDIRWLRCDIKTLNLLPNVLAKQEAVENGAVEAILHRGDTVTEASASNVFIVKNGELYTHPANNYILNGITRQTIIQLCGELGLNVHEEAFTVETLLKADEVFISATKMDIAPIVEVDGRTIGKGKPGSVTRQLVKSFRALYDKKKA